MGRTACTEPQCLYKVALYLTLPISLTHIKRVTFAMETFGVFCKAGSVFLGAFVKLQKATISFVMWVCLSVCLEQLGIHWTDFLEISYLGILRICLENSIFIKA
jgi:hypothetical protein